MFNNIIKEHQQKQAQLRAQSEKHKKEALAACTDVTNGLLDSVNLSVAAVHTKQAQLEGEAKSLQKEAAQFVKQTGQWLKLYDNFSTSLKELGDVVNWSQVLENDLDEIVKSMEDIEASVKSVPVQPRPSISSR
eukprot:GILI01025871.1.p1 GENE.GILI01025871.1~~GILI01025871.1.p1  ORF type:complete len:134 (-),score=28.98 GILI01025871.1:41-442(-)